MPGLTFLPRLHTRPQESSAPGLMLQDWLEGRIREMRRLFAAKSRATQAAAPEAILATFLHHEFNYQSKGKTAHLAPGLLQTFARAIDKAAPLEVFFLYHGGYRSQVGAELAHVFAPDLTEMMLLWQVARLKARIDELHAPGLRFGIVINNGVAAYTNGIPQEATNAYVDRLRRLIDRLGASETVWVLNQAELGDFAAQMNRVEVFPKAAISQTDHGIVERFLGRRCSVEEARLKLAVYEQAEAVWGLQVRGLVAEAGGIFCRQVAQPACLSFRPFPGGAIRVQNGAVTFHIAGGQVSTRFVTPLTWARETPQGLDLALDLFDGLQPEPPRLEPAVAWLQA